MVVEIDFISLLKKSSSSVERHKYDLYLLTGLVIIVCRKAKVKDLSRDMRARKDPNVRPRCADLSFSAEASR